MRLGVVALVLALLPLAAGCGDPKDDYCSAVKEHQEELTRITSTGSQDSLIKALDIFKDLLLQTLPDSVESGKFAAPLDEPPNRRREPGR